VAPLERRSRNAFLKSTEGGRKGGGVATPKLIVDARVRGGSINSERFLPRAGEIFRRTAEMAELRAREVSRQTSRGAFIATDLPADLPAVYL